MKVLSGREKGEEGIVEGKGKGREEEGRIQVWRRDGKRGTKGKGRRDNEKAVKMEGRKEGRAGFSEGRQ